MTDQAHGFDLEFTAVIPCYNEQENAAAIAAAVIAELEKVSTSFDIIFIDNASTDDTVPIIRQLCAADARIRLIANTRNFGQMRSPTHALFEARGRAVIGLCADFQDPPELIGQFVARWRGGAEVVLGVREPEPTSTLMAWFRGFSYKFAARFGDYPIVPNATGFGIFDRKVIQAIASLHEPEPFFRGMLVETGYPIETITYSRPLRRRGKSSNNFFTLLDFALSSLASFSKKSVRLPFFIGVALGIFSGICLVIAGLALLFGDFALYWLIAAAVEIQVALLFVFLGLLGDQARLIAERGRGTPLVFERERVNFPAGY
jgi:glycosyltransferase involved in cell wall biosynthesis